MRNELVDVNGQRLNVSDTGGGGPVVLFAHGNQMDLTMWSPVIELLSPDVRCIAWDMRLHGASEDDGLPYTYWDAARDALAIIDWAGVDRATIAGHSQGGFTALRAALLAPERIAGLVLVDTMARAFSGQSLLQMAAARDALSAGDVEATATALLAMSIGDEAIEAEWKQRQLRQPAARQARALGVLMGADDILDRVSTVTAPAAVIHGDADQPIPIEHGQELARLLPNGHLVTLAGHGHTPPLTTPQAVAEAIVDVVKCTGANT